MAEHWKNLFKKSVTFQFHLPSLYAANKLDEHVGLQVQIKAKPLKQ